MKRSLLSLFIIVAFLMSALAQNRYENGGFEVWEDINVGENLQEPVDWSSVKTSDNESLNGVAPVIWEKSEDAHSGNYSLYLYNVETLGLVATGAITNGRAHTELLLDNTFMYTDPDDSRWYSVMNWRPDSVVGWYKCNPVGGDFGTVKVALHKGVIHIPGDEDSFIGLAYKELSSVEVSSWTRFSIPIEYFSDETPDYQLTILTSGNGTTSINGSEIWFDDLEFIYNNNSIDNKLAENMSVYSYDGKINISITDNHNENYKLVVSDIMGRQLFTKNDYHGEKLIIDSDLQSGIYFITANKGAVAYTKKVFIK
ncbi:MAG: hypothetical protein C0598_07515 [Marinilabiliales bacterium]|nr:MAG: hypothetical protein C0598_07515 [Marinilabiliales bacterium]